LTLTYYDLSELTHMSIYGRHSRHLNIFIGVRIAEIKRIPIIS
jgi:hypothetical protein